MYGKSLTSTRADTAKGEKKGATKQQQKNDKPIMHYIPVRMNGSRPSLHYVLRRRNRPQALIIHLEKKEAAREKCCLTLFDLGIKL